VRRKAKSKNISVLRLNLVTPKYLRRLGMKVAAARKARFRFY
jgi:hypothetical protein